MKWIIYKSPKLYEFALKIFHKKNLDRRYSYMSKKIKKGSSVLDVGCGTGLLGKYLYKKCNYKGVDLNKSFINYACKKGLNASTHNIFNFKSYLKKVDVIVVCDVLHHIYPKHTLFLEKIKKYADKIIVCEPYEGHENVKNKHEKLNLLENLKTFLVVFDSDGFNSSKIKFGKKWWYTKRNLKKFFKETLKDRKNLALKEIGGDIIAIYDFKNSKS
jgi:SAM-dependent methyltransferase